MEERNISATVCLFVCVRESERVSEPGSNGILHLLKFFRRELSSVGSETKETKFASFSSLEPESKTAPPFQEFLETGSNDLAALPILPPDRQTH